MGQNSVAFSECLNFIPILSQIELCRNIRVLDNYLEVNFFFVFETPQPFLLEYQYQQVLNRWSILWRPILQQQPRSYLRSPVLHWLPHDTWSWAQLSSLSGEYPSGKGMDFVGFSGGIKFFERAGCMLPGSLCGQERCQCHYHSTMLRRRILNHRVTRGNLYLYLTRSHSICNKNIIKLKEFCLQMFTILKSVHFIKTDVRSSFLQNCGSFQYNISWHQNKVNWCCIKTTTNLREMRIAQLSS